MPQLIPYFFLNQLSFALLGLGVLIYVFSTYVLPTLTQLFVTRMFITKL